MCHFSGWNQFSGATCTCTCRVSFAVLWSLARPACIAQIGLLLHTGIWVIPPGWGTICDGVNCYIGKCTIYMYYPWLWLLIIIIVISYWRWRDWLHSNLKNNCECALIIKHNRWYIYGCNNWHRHKSCPNLVEWPICKEAGVCWDISKAVLGMSLSVIYKNKIPYYSSFTCYM